MAEPTLNHFASFRFTDAYRALPAADQAELRGRWLEALRGAAERVTLYQVFPTRTDCDLLAWSAVRFADKDAPRDFFERFARAVNPHRDLLDCTDALWGFTKPSIYSRGPSDQEMDPFAEERQSYLIAYPFVKTSEWYLLSRDSRQGMMNQHIRVGHQYRDIKQLLLYSFGLQDQEFIVVYETEDLVRFSELVNELRGTEGRRYTERDTPICAGIFRPAEEVLGLW